MDKKLKIRIIIAICAVVLALVVVGLSTGFFAYLFNAKKSFDNSARYIKRESVLIGECHVGFDDKASFEVNSNFGEEKRVIKISTKKKTEGGKTQISVTLFNDASFLNPLYLSASKVEKGEFEAYLTNAKKQKLRLSAPTVENERYKTIFNFTVEEDISAYDKIALKNLLVTEYKRR